MDKQPNRIEVTDHNEPIELEKSYRDDEIVEDIESQEVFEPLESREPVELLEPAEEVEKLEEPEPTKLIEEEPVKMIEETSAVEPVKKRKNKAVIILVISLIVVAAAGGAAYWWRDKTANDAINAKDATVTTLQATIASLNEQLAKANSAITDTTNADNSTDAATAKAPSDSVAANIKASINSGNTAALEGYMADSVDIAYAASEGLTNQTPAQAVSAVTDFIDFNATTTWDFNLSSLVLSSYGQGDYGTYFPSTAIVGKSSDNKVISFSFDSDAKISTVFLSNNEALLN